MEENNRIYVAIDLKSFYASVECIERNLDPLTTNLVVADNSRTEKTICLAASPSLKAFNIPGRLDYLKCPKSKSKCISITICTGTDITGKSYLAKNLNNLLNLPSIILWRRLEWLCIWNIVHVFIMLYMKYVAQRIFMCILLMKSL